LTGLRQAELLGLRWRDLDFSKSLLSVSQTLFKRRGVLKFIEPKSQHGRRRISLTDKLATFLRDYQGQRELLSFTQRGKGLSLDDLVFSNVRFEPIDASMLSHEFLAIGERIGLASVHFHTLRHSFCSLALMKGASVKVVSEMMGHSSVVFTLSVYAHVMPGQQEAAMRVLNDALQIGRAHV
jgi:integrase